MKSMIWIGMWLILFMWLLFVVFVVVCCHTCGVSRCLLVVCCRVLSCVVYSRLFVVFIVGYCNCGVYDCLLVVCCKLFVACKLVVVVQYLWFVVCCSLVVVCSL